jgi:hypothetical protein
MTKNSAHAVAIGCLAAVSFTACASDTSDDPTNDGDPDTPVDEGTVVPPDDIGVGGGAPVDNLDEGGIGNPQSDVDNNQPSQQDG